MGKTGGGGGGEREEMKFVVRQIKGPEREGGIHAAWVRNKIMHT